MFWRMLISAINKKSIKKADNQLIIGLAANRNIYLMGFISTRLFFIFPASVELSAIGLLSPSPLVFNLDPSIPLFTKYAFTAFALSTDNIMFLFSVPSADEFPVNS